MITLGDFLKTVGDEMILVVNETLNKTYDADKEAIKEHKSEWLYCVIKRVKIVGRNKFAIVVIGKGRKNEQN